MLNIICEALWLIVKLKFQYFIDKAFKICQILVYLETFLSFYIYLRYNYRILTKEIALFEE